MTLSRERCRGTLQSHNNREGGGFRNSLPNHVAGAESVNSFRNRLDKHWEKEELQYDYRSPLSGMSSYT